MTKMNRKSIVIIGGIVIIATYLVAQFIISERLEDTRTTIELQQSEQRTLLLNIAETTARNGADEITEAAIKDCTVLERTRFDDLLGRLNDGLPNSELSELERLFGRCGTFYAERKVIMVSRLNREVEVYKTYTDQLSALTGNDRSERAQMAKWDELVKLEQEQSQLFSELVSLQDEIIATLLAGKSAKSDEIEAILGQVAEVQGNLLLKTQQATSVRNELISL